jgi:hypothetical protein
MNALARFVPGGTILFVRRCLSYVQKPDASARDASHPPERFLATAFLTSSFDAKNSATDNASSSLFYFASRKRRHVHTIIT